MRKKKLNFTFFFLKKLYTGIKNENNRRASETRFEK